MKVGMSPKGIEDRLKPVGELTRACLLIRQNGSEKNFDAHKSENKNDFAPADFMKRRTRHVK